MANFNATKKIDFENIEFGILRDPDILNKNIETMSATEIVEAFAYLTSNYNKIRAYILERRPDAFEEFEQRHLCIQARAMVKGIQYLLERSSIENIDDDRLVEILYDIAEPDDLEVLMSLPDEIRKKLDETIEYHRFYDDPHKWIWEYRFLSRTCIEE